MRKCARRRDNAGGSWPNKVAKRAETWPVCAEFFERQRRCGNESRWKKQNKTMRELRCELRNGNVENFMQIV